MLAEDALAMTCSLAAADLRVLCVGSLNWPDRVAVRQSRQDHAEHPRDLAADQIDGGGTRAVSTRSDRHHRSKQTRHGLVLNSTRDEHQAGAPIVAGPRRERHRRVK